MEKKVVNAGYYTRINKLIGERNPKERYMMYNHILFENIKDLRESIIIINELGNGGIIIAKNCYSNKCISKLREANKDKFINIIKKDTNEYDIVKIALEIKDKHIGFKID